MSEHRLPVGIHPPFLERDPTFVSRLGFFRLLALESWGYTHGKAKYVRALGVYICALFSS